MRFVDPTGLTPNIYSNTGPTLQDKFDLAINEWDWQPFIEGVVEGYTDDLKKAAIGILNNPSNPGIGVIEEIYAKPVAENLTEFITAILEEQMGLLKDPVISHSPNPLDKSLDSGMIEYIDDKQDEVIEFINQLEKKPEKIIGKVSYVVARDSLLFGTLKYIDGNVVIVDAAAAGVEGEKLQNVINDFFEGQKPRLITNKSGDKILMTPEKKIRMDFLNPHGDTPHMHFEVLKGSKWKDAFDTHRFYPKE